MPVRSYLKISVFVLSFFLLITCVNTQSASNAMEPKALFEKRCSRCHSVDKTNRTESKEWWTTTVNTMKKKFFSGISDEEATVITDYLVKTKSLQESAPVAGKAETPAK